MADDSHRGARPLRPRATERGLIRMGQYYDDPEPRRADIDISRGPTLLELGADWCGHCQAAHSLIASALTQYPNVRHIKVADASGRPLGRSFHVKLWPTLIFLRDGQELARAVRPADARTVLDGLAAIA